MFKNKLEKKVALIALLLGTVAGSYQYLPDIDKLASGSNSAIWEDAEVDTKALANTPPLEAILNLRIPSSSASIDAWGSHLDALDRLEGSHKLFGRSHNSKLGAFYAQVALEKPEAIYQRLNNENFNVRRAANLIEAGLLTDWYKHVENIDQLMIKDEAFILSYAAIHGVEDTRKRIAQSFLPVNFSTRPQKVMLESLAYAYPAMTIEQQKNIIPLLKGPQFKYDPRDVINLRYLNVFKNEDLVQLIKSQAYSNKSMSSYMSDATLLGDTSYIRTFVNDVKDNAKQPTNFYCGVCSLAISTDGLIGSPLLSAASQGRLKITPIDGLHGEVVTLTQGQVINEAN